MQHSNIERSHPLLRTARLLIAALLILAATSYALAAPPDTVRMKNGDVFQGHVQIERIGVNTGYGIVTLPREQLAALDMTGAGDRRNVETLITRAGDRYSGFLMEQAIPVTLAAGNVLRVRKETLERIEFGGVTAEAELPPHAVVMRNTDAFRSEVLTEAFEIEASYGLLTFPLADIARIEFEGNERIVGKVTLRDDKGSFQGTLRNEEIEIRTGAGQVLAVYRDQFQQIALELDESLVAGSLAQAVAAGGGGLIEGRYRIQGTNGDIVLDTVTGLEWQRCSLGQTWDGKTCTGEAAARNWNQARQAADQVSGWRLPNIQELRTLVYCSSGQPARFKNNDAGCSGNYERPTIVAEAFPNTPRAWFWSASPVAGHSDRAWFVNFLDGFDFSNPKSHNCRVRLVRGGQ